MEEEGGLEGDTGDEELPEAVLTRRDWSDPEVRLTAIKSFLQARAMLRMGPLLRLALCRVGTADLCHSQEVALYAAGDDETVLKNTVTIMTIHASKGLEFKSVVVAGCEESTLPLPYSTEDELREERRVFFVAITRAEDFLLCTHALYSL